jgi:hypothetical protein
MYSLLLKEALDGLADFNIGGKIIQTVKYADGLVLMAKEETVLQGMIDRLTVTITIDLNQLEKVKCFKYLGSMLTDDGRSTCQI